MKHILKTLLTTMIALMPLTTQGYIQIFEGAIFIEQSEALNLVENFIGPSPTILEAGAHYGTDTISFNQLWPSGNIISFEPNPNAYLKLSEAVTDCNNVTIVNAALNTYNGTATLNVCYGSTGDNPLYEGASSLLTSSEEMKIHYHLTSR